MHTIDGDGHIDNRFVEEDVNIGRQPTQITADWMNAVQEELSNFIEDAGITLSKTNNYQLLMAFKKMRAVIGEIAMFPFTNPPSDFLVADGSEVSRTAYSQLFNALVTSQDFTSQTFTVTIASPAVFTKTAHGFKGGERLRLSSTGTLPTGLNTTTDYFVIYIDANTFRLTATEGSTTAINTSGTQSGTHSFLQSLWGLGDGSSTFKLPDLRDRFIRGVNPSTRTVASYQSDAFQVHDHYIPTPTGAAGGRGCLTDDVGRVCTTNNFFETSAYYYTENFGTSGTTASETRPKNVALLPCIRYQ